MSDADLDKILKLDRSTYRLRFDRSKFGFEWGWTWRYLISPVIPAAELVNYFELWQNWTLAVSLYLEEYAQYPTHRDLHSRNILILNDRPFYIDFQDGRLGSQYYDLISLVYDSYLPFSEEFEQVCLEYFLKKQSKLFDSELYWVQIAQRTLKAAGSFASFAYLKKDYRYQSYIRPTLDLTLRSLSKIQKLAQTSSIQKLIHNLLAYTDSY